MRLALAGVVLWALAGEGQVQVPPPPPGPKAAKAKAAPPPVPAASPPLRQEGEPPPPAPVSLPAPDVELPPDSQCPALPAVRPPLAFGPGEVLEYDLDALGMVAGQLRISVRPVVDGAMSVRVEAATNTLFSKIRRVTGNATSFLNPRTLRPLRYLEDATENGVHKTSRVQFRSGEHLLDLDWLYDTRSGKATLRYGPEGLDVAGAAFLVRMLPWKVGAPICFDVYAIRRVWRLVGKVEAREHVSLPVGEFEAFHLSGVAIRTDDRRQRREVHLWISDDARRLPLAVVGTIDLGAVRATLTAFSRPGEKPVRAEDPKSSLKW
ncbi:MAG TPA: DUF3108 domain-containing protein [Myxococcales bacterium]|nr:DUF3108 domain-containing protein [Myxococcales bacterium]